MEKVVTSLKEKVFYAFGNAGGYILWVFTATFITKYATDCMTLSKSHLATLGTIILLCRFFDGISDILMGVAVERTHTKLGKARPWFGISAVPLAVVFAMMFMANGFSDTGKLIFVSIVYFVFAVIMYTMNNISFNAMMPMISNDAYDQTKISTLDSVFTSVGGFVTFIAIPVMNAMGGIEKQSSWTSFVIILAVISLAMQALCFFNVKEKPEITGHADANRQKGDIMMGLKVLLKTKYFYIAVFMFLINFYMSLSVQNIGPYFAEFVLGNVNLYSTFGIAVSVTTAIGLVLTPLFVKKLGKRGTMMLAIGSVVLGNTIGSIFPESITMGYIACAVKGFGLATVMCELYTLAPDIVTYIELKTGIRIEGLAASANSFGCKIGSGLGSAVVLWAIAACGYDVSLTVQPASALTVFKALYWWVPCILSAILFLLATRWDIDKQINSMKASAVDAADLNSEEK